MGQCKTCGSEILWVKTSAGKWLPLDPVAVEGGNICLDGNYNAEILSPPQCEELEKGAAKRGAPAPRLYKSHFATCPQAAGHRRPRMAVRNDESN